MSRQVTFSYNGAELRLLKLTNLSTRHVKGAELNAGRRQARGITETRYVKVNIVIVKSGFHKVKL